MAGQRAVAPVTSIAQWDEFEASFAPDVTPANPFDPAEIDVRADFSPQTAGCSRCWDSGTGAVTLHVPGT